MGTLHLLQVHAFYAQHIHCFLLGTILYIVDSSVLSASGQSDVDNGKNVGLN
jgi:hypothetical protein